MNTIISKEMMTNEVKNTHKNRGMIMLRLVLLLCLVVGGATGAWVLYVILFAYNRQIM